MSNPGDVPPNAILYIQLASPVSTSFDYDAQAGRMSARCGVEGVVWNTESQFRGARVHVTFLNRIDGRMEGYARTHGLTGACGSLEVARELISEAFEDEENETITLPQIAIWVGIDSDSFRSIQTSIALCNVENRSASMTVTFSHNTFSGTIMPLERLNLSLKRDYPIVAFNVSCVSMANDLHDKSNNS